FGGKPKSRRIGSGRCYIAIPVSKKSVVWFTIFILEPVDMKNKIQRYMLWACIVVFSACSLDKDPYTALTNNSIDDTPGAIEALSLGNYHTLKSWVENWHRVTEYPSDNVSLSGTT